MTDSDWSAGVVRALGVRLEGEMLDEVDDRGRRIDGRTLLLLLNAHNHPVPFTIPRHQPDEAWKPVFDTARPRPPQRRYHLGDRYEVEGHSAVVLELRRQRAGWLGRLFRERSSQSVRIAVIEEQTEQTATIRPGFQAFEPGDEEVFRQEQVAHAVSRPCDAQSRGVAASGCRARIARSSATTSGCISARLRVSAASV